MALDTNLVDYTSLSALTKDQYIPKLVDNIKKKSVLLSKFLSMSKPNASGNKIVVPVEYADADASNYGFYSKYEDLSVKPSEFAKQVSYDWSQAYSSVAISGFEERVNDNPEKLVDLLSSKMKNVEKTFMKFFSDALYGKESSGLNSLDEFAGDGDIGNIEVANNSWWKGAFDIDLSTRIDAVDDINGTTRFLKFSHIMNEILREALDSFYKDSGESPNLIVVPSIVLDAYEQHLSDKKRTPTLSASVEVDGGFKFQSMSWRGIPITADPSCPEGKMYVMNTEYLKMIHSRKANFTFTGFREPVTQDAKVGHVLWMGQLICTNRAKAVGRYSGLPTDYVGLPAS